MTTDNRNVLSPEDRRFLHAVGHGAQPAPNLFTETCADPSCSVRHDAHCSSRSAFDALLATIGWCRSASVATRFRVATARFPALHKTLAHALETALSGLDLALVVSPETSTALLLGELANIDLCPLARQLDATLEEIQPPFGNQWFCGRSHMTNAIQKALRAGPRTGPIVGRDADMAVESAIANRYQHPSSIEIPPDGMAVNCCYSGCAERRSPCPPDRYRDPALFEGWCSANGLVILDLAARTVAHKTCRELARIEGEKLSAPPPKVVSNEEWVTRRATEQAARDARAAEREQAVSAISQSGPTAEARPSRRRSPR